MMECPRCGLRVVSRYHLSRHVQKKILCKPLKRNLTRDILLNVIDVVGPSDENYSCDCGKTYVQKQNLYRHRRECDTYLEYSDGVQRELLLVKQELKELKQQVLPNVINNNINNTINSNVTNYGFVFVNKWDANMDIKYIENTIGNEMAKPKGILRLTKKVFLNEYDPKNHNIYAPTTNKEDIKIYTGTEFITPSPDIDPIKETIVLMRNTLTECVQREPADSDIWERIDPETCLRYHEDFANNPSSQNEMIQLFYNHKRIVEKTHGITTT